jgi:diguanylate cyclase (GGDEF)-like protein
MLNIDPELLSNTSHSPYRAAFEHGYRRLRFDGALEEEFQHFYTAGHLERLRFAGYLAIVLFALFVVIDAATLSAHVAVLTGAIRLGFIIPCFVVVLWMSYKESMLLYMTPAVFVASLTTGLGTVAVIGTALSQGQQIPYEGILLVTLFIYLIACLQWWRALACNLITLFAFIVMEVLYQADTQTRLYAIIFMFAANAVGAYGSYFLEFNVRTMFLANNLLNELAEFDGLTGLSNRRTLNIHLDRVWRQAVRDKNALAVAMIDIDHFKKYNDRYGHAQGDVALKAVADVISRHARRPMDLTARYGGEEFALVWHNPDPAELPKLADALVDAVAALSMPHADGEHGVITISIGVARLAPQLGEEFSLLMQAADAALYDAKHRGRNQVAMRS